MNVRIGHYLYIAQMYTYKYACVHKYTQPPKISVFLECLQQICSMNNRLRQFFNFRFLLPQLLQDGREKGEGSS